MVAAVAGIALTSALGVWQLGRGNEKAAQAEHLSSAQNGPVIVNGATGGVGAGAIDILAQRDRKSIV